jgi:hypothetical protein
MRTITGSGRLFPRVAAIYMPTPKNAAVAREICPVGPENMTQLDVNTIYMNIVDRSIVVNIGAKEGKVTRMSNPTSRIIPGIRNFFDFKGNLFIGLLPHQASRL